MSLRRTVCVVGCVVGFGVWVMAGCDQKAPHTPPSAVPAPRPAPDPVAAEPVATPTAPKREVPSETPRAPAHPAPVAAPPSTPAPGGVLNRIETDSGLIIEELKIGDGEEAPKFSNVTVNYVGTLADGKEFQRSTTPVTFSLLNVVKAWQEGIPGMKIGGKRRLLVPPELGYGARGNPPSVPPNAMLIFEIELVDLPR